MFNRIELKFKAKEILKRENTYWISFAVCILIAAVPNILTMFTSRLNAYFSVSSISFSIDDLEFNIPEVTPLIAGLLIGALLLQCVFSIFLFQPLEVGAKRFFIKSAHGDNSFSSIFDIFKSENYMNVVKILFFKNIYLLLWSFVFIIPYTLLFSAVYIFDLNVLILYLSFFGMIPMIMKYYSYFMIEYIVGDNPNVPRKEAFEKSKELMNNCRYKTFILQLSFFGWMLLGVMACGIGVVFVTPYIEATMVQLYFALKNNTNKYDFCYE